MIADKKYVNIISSPAVRENPVDNSSVNNININITENGTYEPEEPYTGFGIVNVSVPNGVETKRLTSNGIYYPSRNNIGFSEVEVDVESAVLTTKNITTNGTYNASSDNADGYSSVTVDIPDPLYYGIPSKMWFGQQAAAGTYTPNFTPLRSISDYLCYGKFEGAVQLVGIADFSTVETIGAGGLCGAFDLTAISGVRFDSLRSVYTDALNYAFGECYSLTGTISFPSLQNIFSFGSKSFYSAFNYTSITTADFSALRTVSGISAFECAFKGCESLTNIKFDALITVTGESAFQNAFDSCSALTSVLFHSLSTVTGEMAFANAFSGCTSLTSLSFPVLTNVGTEAQLVFEAMLEYVDGCTVHFPAALQATIGSWACVVNGFDGTNTTVLFDL